MEKISKRLGKKFAHNIKLSVFVHQQEGIEIENKTAEEAAANALKRLSAADVEAFEKNMVKFERTIAEGLGNEKVIILTIIIDREKYIKNFLENLVNNLENSQKKRIITQAESRLDREFAFYLRLDKDSFLHDKFELTDTGNCFHVRIHLATFPKKREAALKLINELFS